MKVPDGSVISIGVEGRFAESVIAPEEIRKPQVEIAAESIGLSPPNQNGPHPSPIPETSANLIPPNSRNCSITPTPGSVKRHLA